VHSGKIDDSATRMPNGEKVPPLKFVDEVEEVLRETFHQAIQNSENFKQIDWEELVFRSSGAATCQ